MDEEDIGGDIHIDDMDEEEEEISIEDDGESDDEAQPAQVEEDEPTVEETAMEETEIRADRRAENNPLNHRLTIYEAIAVLGERAEQLQHGAQTTLNPKSVEGYDVLRIALEELINGKCPIMVCRTYPNGSKVIIRTRDAIIPAIPF